MALVANLQHAMLFKKVVESMKDLCKDVNFDFTETGVQVQSMDSSHVALVSLLLRESAFSEYKCERAMTLGMNIESLCKILRMCGPNDMLKIRHQHPSDAVTIQCEGQGDDRMLDVDLKLISLEAEHMDIPEQHYKVVVKMPSAEFARIVKDLKEFGETIHIEASKDRLTFSVAGDIGTPKLILRPREAERAEDKITLTVHEPLTATFALRYLVNFSRASPLSGQVELGLGTDAPLLVKYDVDTADNGHMQFYLAPKIDE